MKNFKKVVLTFISVALVLVPSTLFAATVEVKNEEELFKAISSDNTIILQSDVTLTKALEIKGSNVTIDLNGNTLTVENGYIDLFEGKLEFTGKGIVKDIRVREKVTSTIWVEGSNDVNAKDFSTLVIGKDVTIDTTQWGITISNLDSNNKAYGVTVNFDGTLISSAVKGGGITVFGNVKNDGKIENAPVINLGKTASVKVVGDTALYGAGMGVWNINGGIYEGKSAIGIKSGKLVINDGTFTATGDPKTGELYGNGIISTGSSIQIENNKGYAGNIEITINGGTFKSDKGLSIYIIHQQKTKKML